MQKLMLVLVAVVGLEPVGLAQTKGQTQTYNESGVLVPGFPFACNVDGGVFMSIADCVNFLTPPTSMTGFGGVITSNVPGYIKAANGLPWDPQYFTGILRLGRGGNSTTTCGSAPYNCWLTDVPIIVSSGMAIVGSGHVVSGGNLLTGTVISPSGNFPAALGQPSAPTLTCMTGGTPGVTLNLTVGVVEVNNLNSYGGITSFTVPGFSAESATISIGACAAGDKLRVQAPATLGSGTFGAKDFRVFASSTGVAGSETLLYPDGTNFKCHVSPTVDSTYACGLGTGNEFADTFSFVGGGDSPNLVDLSNPLVVDIGPSINTGNMTQNQGFWAVLQNLTLAQLLLPRSANTPNVAFWNPSDQENSGLSSVGFTGPFGSTTDSMLAGGASIYIGNHAPNGFVSNVQTDGNPTSGTFYGMILDGRGGFGTALGTARIIQNSTFTPGKAGATVHAAALVTGANAVTDFLDDHFELSGGDCIQVVNGASASAEGNIQSCNPFIRLCSASDAACTTSPAAGGDVAVRNITTMKALGPPPEVVLDDLNNVALATHVSDYSTAKNAASLQIGAGPATILPPAPGTPMLTLTLPTTGGTIPSSATSPITLSGAGIVACATCVTSVAGTAPIASSGGATPTISITSPLPLANGGTGSANGSVVVLPSAASVSLPPGGTVYVGFPGFVSPTEAAVASPVAVSGTVAAMYVTMNSPPPNQTTFTVRYTASGTTTSSISCSITMPATSCGVGSGTQVVSESSSTASNTTDVEVASGTGNPAASRNYMIALKITAAN